MNHNSKTPGKQAYQEPFAPLFPGICFGVTVHALRFGNFNDLNSV